MGAGKTSVGRAMGKLLGWAFEDLDERIELRERRAVAEIFRDSGETAFREAEHAALKELLKELRPGPEKVVALGGGAFGQARNAALIEAEGIPTVFLDASVEELWRRCGEQAERQGVDRPLLSGYVEKFRELYEARRSHYMKARHRQETDGEKVAAIAAEVIQTLGLGQDRGRSGGGRRRRKQ